MSSARTDAPTMKSTMQTAIAENGKISRGKYTFVTRLVLLVRETTENRSDEASRFHAHKPQYANSGYGTPVSIGATRMNTTENTAVFTSGMKMAQPNPMIVCL